MRAAFVVGVLAAAACGGGGGASPASSPSPPSSSSFVGPTTRLAGDDDTRDATRAARALVFRAQGFPTVDAPAISDGTLDAALAGLPAERTATVDDLVAKLRLRDFDVLVLPYGSAFPVDAWPRIRSFLARGGGLAVLGGAPFHEPVRVHGSDWIRGPRQTSFAGDLLLGPAEPIARPVGGKTVDVGLGRAFPDPSTTWSLTPRLAANKDLPDEHGSAGPRDGTARPLVHVLDRAGVARGCALLEIDRRLGDQAGARWLLATSDAALGAPEIHAIVARALEGASEITAVPVRAAVEQGEPAQLRVHARRFFPRAGDALAGQLDATVDDAAGKRVFAGKVDLAGPPEVRTGVVFVRAKLPPGLYRAHVGGTTTGFFVKDEKLPPGPRLTVTRDWLRKDGKAFPVVGTTYMGSEAQRKLLFEPNPAAWDRDFAEMQLRGINFVRTGLWTAWSRVMLDPGAVDEGVLSALDAYVLAAARHGIVVCFNLFAFLPPSFTGDNPYLDPRALQGQRELLTLLGSRFRGTSWVHWDLINEPSYAPRAALWTTRPIGDAHEKRAWQAWVKARHGDDISKLRALWHEPADDTLGVPRGEDFTQVAMQIGRRPRKARDFMEFKEAVVAAWAAEMRDVLRAAAGKDTLVTLGQDEGGIHERPTQQMLASSLDYTAVHTWWKNDDLLWDGVVTKVIEKPSLHQETGLMRLEDLDGAPWRTPEAAAKLLERKVAYAFAGRGTGVVEWAWNVNPMMPIDEESTIGIYRPDGTAKPELEALTDVAAFMKTAAPYLDDFAPDDVVMVVPHARAFLGKTGAIDATKVAVRVLAERFGVVPTAISDLRLAAAHLAGVKLVLVPGAEVLDEPAAKALLDASRAGTKVVFTGNMEGDSYGLEAPSLRAMGLLGASRPVAVHEVSSWGSLTFEGLAQETLRRADKASPAAVDGAVVHEPLPLELAREREPLAKLYEAVLAAAKVPVMPGPAGVAARVLVGPRAALVTVVNETPERAVRRVVAFGKAHDVPVAPLGARLVLVGPDGAVIAATPGEAIP